MERGMERMKSLLVAGMPALVGGYMGRLAAPFMLLVAASVLDYLSGMAAAPARGQQRSSKTGLRGIVKKLLLWMLVAVGVLLDAVFWYLERTAGVQLPVVGSAAFPIAAMVCIWLLANELVSILENLGDAGVSVPFLLPLVRWVRRGVEQQAPQEDARDGEQTEKED